MVSLGRVFIRVLSSAQPASLGFLELSSSCLILFQAAALLVYRAQRGGDLPAYVKGFQTLVQDYLPIDEDEYHVFKINQMFKDVSTVVNFLNLLNNGRRFLLPCNLIIIMR